MYINIKELRKQVPDNDFNKGAIEMLLVISKNEGWEESETKYFKAFFDGTL